MIDQVVHTPATSTIRDYFSSPPDRPIGLGDGVDALLTQLNPQALRVVASPTASALGELARIWPGALRAGVGRIGGGMALASRPLVRLDVVLAVALLLGAVSAARIFGQVWFYLLLWAIPILRADAGDDRVDDRPQGPDQEQERAVTEHGAIRVHGARRRHRHGERGRHGLGGGQRRRDVATDERTAGHARRKTRGSRSCTA